MSNCCPNVREFRIRGTHHTDPHCPSRTLSFVRIMLVAGSIKGMSRENTYPSAGRAGGPSRLLLAGWGFRPPYPRTFIGGPLRLPLAGWGFLSRKLNPYSSQSGTPWLLSFPHPCRFLWRSHPPRDTRREGRGFVSLPLAAPTARPVLLFDRSSPRSGQILPDMRKSL